ncbi:MAG: RadC family protein [Nanoarchaeota archaeon]
MKIKDLPDNSKPRERFLKFGKENLSDAELMAIILRVGTRNKKNKKGNSLPGENVVEMSNRLIAEHGLDKLFDCSLKELQEIKGIGPSKAMQILSIAELGKRYNESKNPITRITNAKDVFDYFKYKLKNKKQEEFWVLLLNTRNIIIKEEFITRGVLDAAIIHPREVFKPAIKNSASKIILVHNHPSGNPQPSEEDIDVTKKIMNLGKEMDIKVLDSVIIGSIDSKDNPYWSWIEDN